ncbi:replicative DNA helicase [Pleurocapsa sp. FMAR1]|uniref:replicative DNA helicase n=1 Tax=Pleurocapsa sp. FMAR1 TaxID=3040204 RepID=UPI0029C7866E|nr:replicative DNA helicase [Pleurocapsa sp. FMAR1]
MAEINNLPPASIEAEEAILGGILFDPEAITRVAELVVKNAFYVKAHQEIYQAALTLNSKGKPTDFIALSTYLSDRDLLEQVGGTTKLAQLLNRTVSAVNIDRYANLIMEKYIRRQLITSGHEIVDLGYDNATELEVVLDSAEQKIFRLTQERPQEGLVPIAETLVNTFNTIEELHQNTALPGVPSGYYDLDAMTSGFSRSDLIIIAGRPSMGKTAFALCVASNIARNSKLPIAVFSLEMSREQLTQRLLSSEARIPSNRLRSGRIAQNEFGQLIDGVEKLSELPIYIDDTANLTVMQMRSQVRRLQAQQKDPLGLVMIDYLQLMEGGDNDNRVQQLSKMTRSLKGLARELNVPIVALSQLSRGVEQRTNKRPMLSDLRESGCLSGDSLITMVDTGRRVPIKDLVGKSGFSVWALNQASQKIEPALVSRAFATGIKSVFSLQTALGRKICATANHRFLTGGNGSVQEPYSTPVVTIHGWKRLDELVVGDYLAVPRILFSSSLLTISQLGNNYCGTSLYKQNVSRERASKLATVVKSQEIENLADSDLYWDKVISIEAEGKTEVFDLTIPIHHNFIANDIVVHNSIEQDADLVMMIYRDEYYNPDTPDRGITEVSIVKHRNGPVGTVKLLFNAELTKFESLAKPGGY